MYFHQFIKRYTARYTVDGDPDLYIGTQYSGVKFYKNIGNLGNPIFSQQVGIVQFLRMKII